MGNLQIGRTRLQKKRPYYGWAIGHRPLTSEVWTLSLVSPCVICGGQSVTGTGFSLSPLVVPCQYHSTVAVHTRVSSGGRTVGPLVAAVQRHSLTPPT
jgi:hypothetical protein